MKLIILTIFAIWSTYPQHVEGDDILFISTISSKSQKNFMDGIIQQIDKRGHKITVISPFATKGVTANVKDVVLEDMDITPWTPNAFIEGDMGSMTALLDFMPSKCSEALGRAEVQDVLKKKYDAVLVKASFCDCFLKVAHKMKVPIIMVSSIGPLATQCQRMGLPHFLSYSPNFLVGGTPPFSFTTRLLNILTFVLGELYTAHYIWPWMERECIERGLCDEEKSINEISYNVSLTIVNSVRVLEKPYMPTIPTLVYAGGIHCRPAEPLPKDIDSWLGKSNKHGFIYFSLGSIVKPSDVPKESLDIILKVLGSLPQKILFKWNLDTLENLPSNVLIKKWLPQQDVLGDKRIRLFISHGGLMSTIEATYHGVPVLGMPVFFDQDSNMKKIEDLRTGAMIRWNDLTEEVFREKVQLLLNNEKIRINVAQQSQIMKDYPLSPKSDVDFWVEHVLKYKGGHGIRSPVLDMTWYELYNIDVWFALISSVLIIIALIVTITIWCIKCSYNLLFKKKLKQS